MKQFPIYVFMLLFLFCSKADAQTLVLWHPDGTTTDVELFTQPQVTFAGEKVLITSTVLNIEYNASEVTRFTYKDVATGIKSAQNEADCTQEDGRVIFHGIKDPEKVALYNANGVRVPARFTRVGDDISFSLETLPSGVYLLNVNGQTSKFTKK